METLVHVLGIIWAVTMLSAAIIAPFVGKFSSKKTEEDSLENQPGTTP